MKILGLSTMGNSSACISVNGEVLSAIEEERLSRIKNDGSFPLKSIKKCVESSKVSFSELDMLAVYWKPWKIMTRIVGSLRLSFENINFFKYILISVLFSFFGIKNLNKKYPELKGSWIELFFIKKILKTHFSEFENFNGKIIFLDHHECHASSAVFVSNFKKSVCLTYDGGGESISTAIYLCNEDFEFKKIKSINWPNSLGHYYSAFTGFLGFRMLEGEYKMMGLAPYGTTKYKDIILEKILIKKQSGNYELNTSILNYHMALNGKFSKEMIKLFGNPRESNEDFNQKHRDIAASVQAAFEEILIHMLLWVKSKYSDYENLCIAGGCALNVTANGKIISNQLFKNIFIPPGPHDAGCAIGATFLAQKKYSKTTNTNYQMSNAYLGPVYPENIILNAFKETSSIVPIRLNNLEMIDLTATKLSEGKIIAWFQNASEFGPRALGNRSFLADPRDDNIREVINNKIKKRELFRPFAPSCKIEVKDKYFDINQNSPYMNMVAKVKNNKKEIIPAVTHVDGTARIHTVSRESNELYWMLINRFEEITGVGVLLNTSFNIQEPIVETPEDAINCFLKSQVDMLVIGNYVYSRPD